MRNVLTFLGLIFLAACGDTSAPPAPPVIVRLIVADTAPGFWRRDSLSLASLVVGAITDRGDTVAAPAISWNVPGGFTRAGAQLAAQREARGQLVASTSIAGVPPATFNLSALDNLAPRRWAMEYRCYNSAVVHRGVEEPPIGQDSLIRQRFNGVLTYTTGDFKDLRASMAVDSRTIRFWKDGLVDTILSATTMPVIQDTARAAIYLPSVENLRMTADTPRIYRAAWNPGHTTWCDPSYVGGGSDLVLGEP